MASHELLESRRVASASEPNEPSGVCCHDRNMTRDRGFLLTRAVGADTGAAPPGNGRCATGKRRTACAGHLSGNALFYTPEGARREAAYPCDARFTPQGHPPGERAR